MDVDLGGSDYAFPVAVLAGGTWSNLVMLASGAGGTSFAAVAGRDYQIAVGDAAGLTGAFRLSLRAPLVALPLQQAFHLGTTTILRYTAAARQVALLQCSDNGEDWTRVRTARARQGEVTFQMNQPPESNRAPYYRAVVFDRLD